MKSETTVEVDSLVKVYDGIFLDAKVAFPSLGRSLEKDRLRLRDQIRRHGLKVASIWLPSLDGAFTKGLDGTQLNTANLPLGGCRGCEKVPLFLNGLFKLVFDPCNGCVLDDASINAAYFIHQILQMGKKLRSKVDEGIVQQTVAKFCATDAVLPRALTGLWADPCAEFSPNDLGLLQIPELGYKRVRGRGADLRRLCLAVVTQVVFDRIATSFPLIEWGDMQPKHGPGAVSDLNKRKTSKYDLAWNSTLESMLPCTEFAATSNGDFEYDLPQISDVVAASRLCAVPKTAKGPRLIAAEPAANMFMQQALKAILDETVSHTWLGNFINFHDQGPNQWLAVQSSKDCRLATVDLSEASDRVSCAVVEAAFCRHPQLLRLLAAVRSQCVDFSRFGGVSRLPINKYASMGNATTFPIESLIFLGCALSAVILKAVEFELHKFCSFHETCNEYSDEWSELSDVQEYARWIRNTIGSSVDRTIRSSKNQVRVFGDDIVVPVDCLGYLYDVLKLLGFVVNDAKSFAGHQCDVGGFRESCGVDAFRGYNITPVKPAFVFDASGVKRPKDVQCVESLVSQVAFANNLHKAGLWNAAAVVTNQLLPAFTRQVATGSQLGLFSFSGSYGPTKLRWNPDFQVREIRLFAPITKSERIRAQESRSNLIQLAVEQPALLHDWSGGFDADQAMKIAPVWKAI